MDDNEQTAEKTPDASETLGDALRRARGAKDLSIEQIANELRIEARHLAALEENRLDQIGVPVFVKGYIRQYGQRLGLDIRDLLALYYRQTDLAEVQIHPSKTIKLRDERQITRWVVALVVVAAVVTALVVWWLNGASGLTNFIPSVITSAPLEEPRSESSGPGPTRERSRPASADPAPLRDAPQTVQTVVSPALDGRSSPADIVSPAPQSGLSPPTNNTAPSSAAPGAVVPDVAITLDLTFEEESWAEVTDARDTRLFYGLGAQGRHSTLRGEPPLTVLLGNAPGVQVKVDGEPYPIPRQGRQGNLARFSIDIAEE